MPSEIGFLAALLVGFLGSAHCLGMCGGIAGTLAVSTTRARTMRFFERTTYLLAFNLGRIASYALAGVLAAAIGHLGLGLLSPALARGLALGISAAFMIALGLYLAGWWSFLPWLEKQGGRLWRMIEPVGRRLLPVRSRTRAFEFGLIWGWLPCGLVYSALAWSATTADPLRGGLIMLGFGLGTLPTVFAMGLTGQVLQRLRTHSLFRRAAGVSIILFAAALLTLVALDRGGHAHHGRSDHASQNLHGQ